MVSKMASRVIQPAVISFDRWLLAAMGIIASLMPLLTLLLSALLLGEAPSVGTVAGGLLSLLGLATLTYAGYGVLLRKCPMPVPTWHMLYAQICFGVLLLFPGYWLTPSSPLTAANLPLVLYAGIAASIVSAFLWMEGGPAWAPRALRCT